MTTPVVPPSPQRRAELLQAAAAWRNFEAIDPGGMKQGLRETCEAAARALEMEAEDGIARCCCCFKPFGAPMALFRR
jgi:hypothetical protein